MNEPRTMTEAIDRIRTRLLPLPFVDQIFARVHLHNEEVTGADRPQLVPMVYVGEGEYMDCRPNDDYNSVMFFFAPEPERSDFNRARHSPTHAIRTERSVVLIGWANLEKLPEEYRGVDAFPEELKVQLKEALKWEPCIIRIGDWRDGLLNDVFRPFIVSTADRKYDRWPMTCFRLDLVIQCIEQKKR